MRIFAVGTKIFGGPGQHLGGGAVAVPPPGPNVEPSLLRAEERLFQVSVPATENARSPNFVRTLLTMAAPVVDNQSCLPPDAGAKPTRSEMY